MRHITAAIAAPVIRVPYQERRYSRIWTLTIRARLRPGPISRTANDAAEYEKRRILITGVTHRRRDHLDHRGDRHPEPVALAAVGTRIISGGPAQDDQYGRGHLHRIQSGFLW